MQSRRMFLGTLLLAGLACPVQAAGALEVGVLRFRVPKDWRQAPAAGLRAAAFDAPFADGVGAHVVFERVPDGDAAAISAGWPALFRPGSVAATSRRWTERVARSRVHMAELTGIWQGGEGADGQRQVMLAALYESRRGLVLVRLLGTPDAATAASDGFWTTVRGAIDAWQS